MAESESLYIVNFNFHNLIFSTPSVISCTELFLLLSEFLINHLLEPSSQECFLKAPVFQFYHI